GKWELGKKLFFDATWLAPSRRRSCADCHHPRTGFSGELPAPPGEMHAPTLINCLYNARQFWDGRASRLEEVVQRTLEDERAGPEAARRHVWGGVIQRLREHPDYPDQFRRVFGTTVTQDAIGKALASYLRTILSGNALYDRAVAENGGSHGGLTADHFE